MSKKIKIFNAVAAVLLAVMLVLSIVDTKERRYNTSFDQGNIMTHIEKLSENGPRSVTNKEANEKAVEYIASKLKAYGAVESESRSAPAYTVQQYVATDETGRYQNFYLKNVIAYIPANAEKPSGDAVMFMGHFDSVPMGQGASDDGVACATMLEAYRYYLEKLQNGFEITNDLVFCFVNGEEYNLFGSRAFMNEFKGFDNIVDRIKFGVNLESRGTDGTLIMFETAENNYDTVKLFSKVNKSVFTCSIATMVYSTMPNSTDFSNFKDRYQGLNMANIGGGEDYHTRNDAPENVGRSYLSQQAAIVEALTENLANYELLRLYDAKESAIFFSYLNITTVVYNHTTSVIIAIIAIIMLALNIVLGVKRGQKRLKSTAKAFLVLTATLILSAAAAYICYYLFQLTAVLFGTIDIHAVGTITYSNIAIVIGLALLVLSITAITANLGCKIFKIEGRDLTRAFAYLHTFLGIVLTFALPDASYLFIFSGIMLIINELVITLSNKDISRAHGELIATALYMPIVIPVIFLATSALGMTMAYVYGLVLALALFDVGVLLVPVCEKLSLRRFSKKITAVSPTEGAVHILAAALIIFLTVSACRPNASVNLQGKQNIAKLPFDDALVLVSDAPNSGEYRIYDLNARRALKSYAPDMEYNGEYYVSKKIGTDIDLKALTRLNGNTLEFSKNDPDSLIYLDFKNIDAESFTVNDGKTVHTYEFGENETYSIKLHSECTVTLNGGKAELDYKEVIRDYKPLIPAEYENDGEKLHFNLWLTKELTLED